MKTNITNKLTKNNNILLFIRNIFLIIITTTWMLKTLLNCFFVNIVYQYTFLIKIKNKTKIKIVLIWNVTIYL